MESCKYNLRPRKPQTYSHYAPYFTRTKRITRNNRVRDCNDAVIPQDRIRARTVEGDSEVVCDSIKVNKKVAIHPNKRRIDGMAKETTKIKVQVLKDRQPLTAQWKDFKKRNSRNNVGLLHRHVNDFGTQHMNTVIVKSEANNKRVLQRPNQNLPQLTCSRPSTSVDARHTTEPNALALATYHPPSREPDAQAVVAYQPFTRVPDEPVTSVSGIEQHTFPGRQVVAPVDHSSQLHAQDVSPGLFRDFREVQTVPQGPIALEPASSTPVLVGEATILARPRITPGGYVYILRVRVRGEIRFLHVDPNSPSRASIQNNLELTEEIIGRHPETLFGDPIVIDGTTYCVVKFRGCDYQEIVEADMFFQEFPELEDNFSLSATRRIAAACAAPSQQDEQEASEDATTGENLTTASRRRVPCCIV